MLDVSSVTPRAPLPSLPWGHALYMVPGKIMLESRERACRLGALKRDTRRVTEFHRQNGTEVPPSSIKTLLDALCSALETPNEHPHKGICLTAAERAEFLTVVRQELADDCRQRAGEGAIRRKIGRVVLASPGSYIEEAYRAAEHFVDAWPTAVVEADLQRNAERLILEQRQGLTP